MTSPPTTTTAPPVAADLAHLYWAESRRHRTAALNRLRAIREAVDQIERDLKIGRPPAYQAGAIASDVIQLGERLAAMHALSDFHTLFPMPRGGK